MDVPRREPKLTIQTPEQIEFEYELAGLGSRFLAFLFDSLVRSFLSLLFLSLVFVLGTLFGDKFFSFVKKIGGSSTQEGTFFVWLFAILGIVLYILNTGYYIFFETVWNGQSPGKRLLDLRVIREGGYPIGFYEAMIRNLLRIVDGIPGNHLVGALCVFFSPKDKRIGDYVAGTIVVKEKSAKIPEQIFQTSQTLKESATLESIIPHLAKVKHQEYNMIVEFLERREEMDSSHRDHMTMVLSDSLTKKLQCPIPENMTAEEFLTRFAEAYRKHMKFL
ncbi:MAG: RDD family protein [Candidatus Omnitrophota bacterium]|nr:MAG: RDD family protein [Candidatus Omnitrophota bacterium]